MASETRQSNLSLMRSLLENPYDFSFFQAVQLLQRYVGGARLGTAEPASKELLRLRPTVSLTFPTADLLGIEAVDASSGAEQRYRVTTSFLGLYASDSPLPTFYTEDLIWKESDQRAVREFLDIFHHRALSLLYRTWEKYRYSIQFKHRGKDEFSRRVFSFVGLGDWSLIDNTGLPSVRLLRFAGLITQRPHSASALIGILKDYFSLESIQIEQCVGRWVRIGQEQRNRLGLGSCTLGVDCSIGERVRDRAGKFRVRVGPLTLQNYLRFLPDSPDYAAMVNLIRLYAPDRLDFDIEVSLLAEETPPLRLDGGSPQRLGWTSWIPSPRQNPSVVHRQPAVQSPKVNFPWPGSAGLRPAAQ